MAEMPDMQTSSYTTSAYTFDSIPQDVDKFDVVVNSGDRSGSFASGDMLLSDSTNTTAAPAVMRRAAARPWNKPAPFIGFTTTGENFIERIRAHRINSEDENMRRYVQILVVDTEESVPVEDALLYKSDEPFFTDATDDELLYTIDMPKLLKDWNEKRVLIEDRDSDSGRKLEPARLRDITVNVVEIARFN